MVDSLLVAYLDNKGVYLGDTFEYEDMELKRNFVLSQFKGKIWQRKDGRYCVKLGGKLCVKKKLEKVEDAIILYMCDNNLVTLEVLGVEYLFEEACSFYVDKNYIKKNTIDRYRCDFNKFIAGADISKLQITDITDIDIADFLNSTLNNYEVTQKCFCNIKSLLLFIFSYTKIYKRISCIDLDSTFKSLKFTSRRFKASYVDPGTQIYNCDDFSKLLDYMYYNYKDCVWLGILLTAYTGVRVGELITLKLSDIDNDYMNICRQEVRYKDDLTGTMVYAVDGCPKGNHFRRVYLSDKAKHIIELIKAEHIDDNYDGDWLLVKNGRRLRIGELNKTLRRICKDIKIDYKSMHKLRKTYGSMLFDAGANDKFIMAQLGHRSISTFHKAYNYNLLSNAAYCEYAKEFANKI